MITPTHQLGFIYFIQCCSIPPFVKIGFPAHHPAKKRLKTLQPARGFPSDETHFHKLQHHGEWGTLRDNLLKSSLRGFMVARHVHFVEAAQALAANVRPVANAANGLEWWALLRCCAVCGVFMPVGVRFWYGSDAQREGGATLRVCVACHEAAQVMSEPSHGEKVRGGSLGLRRD